MNIDNNLADYILCSFMPNKSYDPNLPLDLYHICLRCSSIIAQSERITHYFEKHEEKYGILPVDNFSSHSIKTLERIFNIYVPSKRPAPIDTPQLKFVECSLDDTVTIEERRINHWFENHGDHELI